MVSLYLYIFSILLNNPTFSYEKLLDHNVPIEEKDKGCFLKKSRQISSSEYLKKGVLDSHKYQEHNKDSENLPKNPNAKRDGLNLVLKTEKGLITLKNIRNAENGHDKDYYFIEENQKCNFYLLYYGHGEYTAWLLINGKTGDQNFLIGYPYVSDDCKKLISFNGGFDTTSRGIQFIEHTDNGYKEMCHEKKAEEWEYKGAFWHEGNFYFQIGKSDNENLNQPPKKYYYNWFFKLTN